MTHPSKVRFSGPLTQFAAGFSRQLSLHGYTRDSAGHQVRLMAQVSRWLAEQGFEVDALGTRNVERFLEDRRASGYTTYRTERGMRPILTYLRQLGVVSTPPVAAPEGPVEEMLEHYRSYLTVERGLGIPTARGYIDSVRPFLQGRLSSDGAHVDFDGLNASDVTKFVVARCPSQSHSQAKLTVTVLRSFLRFLHCNGVTKRLLATAVPSAAGWRLAGLPKGLEAREVRSLLTSCDRRTTTGRRDFAIMTVLARLGLRSGEVSALSLDDIDWRSGTLVIRGKGNRMESLPLPVDVGEAVAGYLRRGRPASADGRSVFIRVKAPHNALTSGGVTQVVAAAATRAGLGRVHAHRLRHTAATQMLQAGSPLTEIGQVLRHRRALTTAIYAKVDRDALRTIARPWPRDAA